MSGDNRIDRKNDPRAATEGDAPRSASARRSLSIAPHTADAEHIEMWSVITDRVWSAMHGAQPATIAETPLAADWRPRLVLVGRRDASALPS